MVTKQFRNPQAFSTTLASLGMPQSQALGFLNRFVTLVSVSNLYVLQSTQSLALKASDATDGFVCIPMGINITCI